MGNTTVDQDLFNFSTDTITTALSNGHNHEGSGISFETLYPALVQVFGIIAMGYISGRYNVFIINLVRIIL